MSSGENLISKFVKYASMIDDKNAFKKNCRSYTLKQWKAISCSKTAFAGFATGVVGGPLAIAAEAGDLGYLGAMAGRMCFGIGHILNKNVDYDSDIEGILAVWSGVAKGINRNTLKKRFEKEYMPLLCGDVKKLAEISNKEKRFLNKLKTVFNNHHLTENKIKEKLFEEYLSMLLLKGKMLMADEHNHQYAAYIRTSMIAGLQATTATAAAHTSPKVLMKTGFKVGSGLLAKKVGAKVNTKLLSKAGAKLTSKAGAKISTKWIPIIGGVTSSLINVWVLDTLSDAAEIYYNNDYIILESSLSADTFSEGGLEASELKDLFDDNRE